MKVVELSIDYDTFSLFLFFFDWEWPEEVGWIVMWHQLILEDLIGKYPLLGWRILFLVILLSQSAG